jgi:hypothetical protein
MTKITCRRTIPFRRALLGAFVAFGVLYPAWKGASQDTSPGPSPSPSPESGCRSSQDCRSGELCVIIKVTGNETTDGGGVGSCEPAGCQSGNECFPNEQCATVGAGHANECKPIVQPPEPTPDPPPPVIIKDPPKPVASPSPSPPPPDPPAKSSKPKGPMKAPIKVKLVTIDNVDSRQLAIAKRNLTAELERAFGKDAFSVELSIFDSNQKPGKDAQNYTIYIAGGAEPPTVTDANGKEVGLFEWHYNLTPKGAAELNGTLKGAFDRSSEVYGDTFRNVAVIPADKVAARAQGSDNYVYSNAVTHEVGHILTGVACSDHAQSNPDVCGGVMTEAVPSRDHQQFTGGFVELVKSLAPLTVSGNPLYAAVWQESTANEVQFYNWAVPELLDRYNQMWAEGWRLKLLTPIALGGEVRYTAVFELSEEPEIQVFDWSYEDYRSVYDSLWQQGWRLKLLSPYVINNEVRYTAAWRPSSSGEIQLYDVTFEEYQAEYGRLWDQGWRLKLLSPYVINNEVRYTAVWHESAESELQLYNWTAEALHEKYHELWDQGWRLKLLSPYRINEEIRYIAVFKPGEEGEVQVYDWSFEDYQMEYGRLWDQGWRLKLLSPF